MEKKQDVHTVAASPPTFRRIKKRYKGEKGKPQDEK
jgi:hypothetical protein